MYIYINEDVVPVSLLQSGERLSLSFTNIQEKTLLELYQLFQPDTTPEIVIYDETQGGITSAIYANHKILALHLMNNNSISIDLQVDPLEISEARRISEALQAQLQEMVENNEVISEILTMLANHEERLYALEPHPEEDDGSGDDEE